MRAIPYDTTKKSLYHPGQLPPENLTSMAPDDLLCAELSKLVYKEFESDSKARAEIESALPRLALTKIVYFNEKGSQGFGVLAETRALRFVVFRGTQPGDPDDRMADTDALPAEWSAGGRVHHGMAAATLHLWPAAQRWLRTGRDPVIFTGHSLGAAMATLAATLWQPSRVVTFGSPRVGNVLFAKLFTNKIASRRYVNCSDIVCNMPPAEFGYEHVSPAAYFDRLGVLRENATEVEMKVDQLAAQAEYITDPIFAKREVQVRLLADHSIMNYIHAVRACGGFEL